jgi:beta-carotene 3-hydroxylase
MTGLAVFLLVFAAMEAVSYATHRWLMHGPALGWHASHHAPPVGRFERNDRFPLCFSALGVVLFALAAGGLGWLWPVAGGVTAYGAAYLFVHEVHIHRRLPVPPLGGRYLRWLRAAHGDHHRGGGEPYGMLLPLLRRRTAGGGEVADDRQVPVDQAERVERILTRRPAGPPAARARG